MRVFHGLRDLTHPHRTAPSDRSPSARHGPAVAASGSARRSARPPTLAVLAAPWRSLVDPLPAVATVLRASHLQMLALCILHLVSAGLLMLLLTVIQRASVTSDLKMGWKLLHPRGPIGEAEWMFLLGLCGFAMAAALPATFGLTLVYRSGNLASTWRAAYRVVWLGASSVLPLLLHANVAWYLIYRNGLPSGIAEITSGPMLLVGGGLLALAQVQRVLRVLARLQRPVRIGPRCTGCGYDLRHTAADERCTECGRPLPLSITPGLRGASEFEARGDPKSLLADTLRATFTPRRFYAALRVRRARSRARHFEAWQYFLIGAFVSAFILLMASLRHFGSREPELPLLAALAGMVAVLLLWLAHRTMTTIVAVLWVVRGYFADQRWIDRIAVFESAYLWSFALFSTLLISSFMHFGPWLTDWLGREFSYAIFGAMPEFVLLFGGNALLAAIWFARFRIAGAAIRWNSE